jgi:hypothetical protein
MNESDKDVPDQQGADNLTEGQGDQPVVEAEADTAAAAGPQPQKVKVKGQAGEIVTLELDIE